MITEYDQIADVAEAEEESRWQAVLTRNSSFDGRFVFAVRSTGIYCRPSCPARRPRREQVLFFTLPQEAEQRGFRACLRCRPLESVRDDLHRGMVEKVCQYIQNRLDEEGPITLGSMSAHVSVSPYHLQRTFKRIMGITPWQYVEARRLDRLKKGLKAEDNVTRAMYDAGYSSSSRLYERANGQLGMTPASYRRGGHEMCISYTIVDCLLGKLLVAGTERGVCKVSLGDSEAELEEELRREYPAAEVSCAGEALGQWLDAILSHLQGHEPHLDLPLDVQATAFQWRVWRELQAIPYGKTHSYNRVAQAIGQPKAARAVARACASNPVALVVPCHRVVRENGELGGYRWGAERKQKLLAQEQQSSQIEAIS